MSVDWMTALIGMCAFGVGWVFGAADGQRIGERRGWNRGVLFARKLWRMP